MKNKNTGNIDWTPKWCKIIKIYTKNSIRDYYEDQDVYFTDLKLGRKVFKKVALTVDVLISNKGAYIYGSILQEKNGYSFMGSGPGIEEKFNFIQKFLKEMKSPKKYQTQIKREFEFDIEDIVYQEGDGSTTGILDKMTQLQKAGKKDSYDGFIKQLASIICIMTVERTDNYLAAEVYENFDPLDEAIDYFGKRVTLDNFIAMDPSWNEMLKVVSEKHVAEAAKSTPSKLSSLSQKEGVNQRDNPDVDPKAALKAAEDTGREIKPDVYLK